MRQLDKEALVEVDKKVAEDMLDIHMEAVEGSRIAEDKDNKIVDKDMGTHMAVDSREVAASPLD